MSLESNLSLLPTMRLGKKFRLFFQSTHFACEHRSHTLEACDSTTGYERTPKNANDAIPQGGSRSGGSVLPGSQGARPIGFTL